MYDNVTLYGETISKLLKLPPEQFKAVFEEISLQLTNDASPLEEAPEHIREDLAMEMAYGLAYSQAYRHKQSGQRKSGRAISKKPEDVEKTAKNEDDSATLEKTAKNDENSESSATLAQPLRDLRDPCATLAPTVTGTGTVTVTETVTGTGTGTERLAQGSPNPTPNEKPPAAAPSRSNAQDNNFKPPDIAVVRNLFAELGQPRLAEKFYAYYDREDWHTQNGKPLKNLKAAVKTWIQREPQFAERDAAPPYLAREPTKYTDGDDLDDFIAASNLRVFALKSSENGQTNGIIPVEAEAHDLTPNSTRNGTRNATPITKTSPRAKNR